VVETFSFRGNNISDVKEFAKLKSLPLLRAISLAGIVVMLIRIMIHILGINFPFKTADGNFRSLGHKVKLYIN